MRVALVCTEKLPVPPIRGGAIQAYIDGVAPLLARHLEVTVLGCADPALPVEEVRGGVHHRRIAPANRAGAYYQGVADYLQARPPDLVVVYNRPRLVPVLARAAPGARFILSLHNDMFGPEKIAPGEAAAAVGRCSAILTVSDWLGRRLVAQVPAAAGKVRTVYSGVDLQRFLPRWDPAARGERRRLRRELRLQHRQAILYVGRLSDKKGAHVLLQALAGVARRHPAAVLVVVGSKWFGADDPTDDYVRRLKRLADRHLPDRVRFTGWVPYEQVHRYYWAADLFACASQWEEPLARVHYEAMACGLPIITTRRGGNAEVIDGLGNGLVVDDYANPAAFVRAVEQILADPAGARAMGRRARAVAEAHFGWDRVARDLLAACQAAAI